MIASDGVANKFGDEDSRSSRCLRIRLLGRVAAFCSSWISWIFDFDDPLFRHLSEHRVDRTSEQKRDARNIHPKHEYDYGTKRAVGLVVAIEILQVEPKQRAGDYPNNDRCDRAWTDPDPMEFFEAGKPAVYHCGREDHHDDDRCPLDGRHDPWWRRLQSTTCDRA